MKAPHIAAALLLGASVVSAEDPAPQSALFIKKCDSGIDYPDKGDESLDTTHGGKIYHVRIFHPEVAVGPHFSSPFFWVSEKDQENSMRDFVSVKSHIGGLSWHRIGGYFFAEKEGNLAGYFLQDGFDNADAGSSGLVLLHDGKESQAWRWIYQRGEFQVTDANDETKTASENMLRRIAEVMNHAKEQADGWPGS